MTLPVLHIGFHKCGSTTLQRALFARHPDIYYLGEPDEDPDAWAAVRNALNSLHSLDHKREELDIERDRSLWARATDAAPPGKVPVFSKETLTLFEYFRDPGDDRVARLLREIVGQAKIVVVGRHQLRLIESLYLFHTRGPKYVSFEDWIAERADGPLRLYEFNRAANTYAQVFGRENVAVFLLEDLKASPQEFIRRLGEFIGVDPEPAANLLQKERRNKRTSQRYRIYSKLRKSLGLYIPIGRVTPKPLRDAFNRFVMDGAEAKATFPERWAADFADHFRADNRRLEAEWGVSPSSHDYPL